MTKQSSDIRSIHKHSTIGLQRANSPTVCASQLFQDGRQGSSNHPSPTAPLLNNSRIFSATSTRAAFSPTSNDPPTTSPVTKERRSASRTPKSGLSRIRGQVLCWQRSDHHSLSEIKPTHPSRTITETWPRQLFYRRVIKTTNQL